MSSRVRINHRRLVALRTGAPITRKLQSLGRRQMQEANRDFWATAPKKEREAQKRLGREPFDMTTKKGSDRTRVFVQTTSYPARRQSTSLLRAFFTIKGG